MQRTSTSDSIDASDRIFEVIPEFGDKVTNLETHAVQEYSSPSRLPALDEVACYKPYVGMEFDSLDRAFLFYNEYARIVGFSVRKGKTRKSNLDGSFLFRRFCCSKEGHRRNKRGNDTNETRQMKCGALMKVGVHNQPVTRVGCNAKLDVKRKNGGRWVVQKFDEEHNHECAHQGETHLLRSHKRKQSTQGPVNGTRAFSKPSVGMEFDSLDKAFLFYNEYARIVGFSVRKAKIRKSNIDGSILFRRLCCSKEGHSRKSLESDNDETNQVKDGVAAKVSKRNHLVSRVGCNAKLDLKKANSGKWVVQKFCEEHNHECAQQGEIHLMRSHRCNQSTYGELNDMTPDAGMKPMEAVPDLIREADGNENPEQDLEYHSSEKLGKHVKMGDAQVILSYLRHMQEANPSFFYAIQGNERDKRMNFFWADARSRMDYSYFGDVIYLDTSYGTNKYGRPFAPIVGVNHHQQTVLLGYAILSSKTEESFVWLLETFLKVMSDHHPVSIITNPNAVMAKAIERVLPRTHHRLCLWHIFQNAVKHLSHLYKIEDGFITDFKKCIYESQWCDEFESRWSSLLNKYELRDDEWLDNMYKKRHKWVPAYSRYIFHADMTTSQRIENINSFFNGYLNKSLPLSDFIKQCEKALVSRREKETYEDFISHQTRPVLKLDLPMEQQAADVYTRSVFKEFHNEFCDSFKHIAKETGRAGANSTYMVSRWGHNRNFLVNFNSYNKDIQITCSCQKFEFSGILCRHILKVFMVKNVMLIPETYIRKRWTKKVKSNVVLEENAREMHQNSQKSSALHHKDSCCQHSDLYAKGETSTNAYQTEKHEIEMALKEPGNFAHEETSIVQPNIEDPKAHEKAEGKPPKRTISSLGEDKGKTKARTGLKSDKHGDILLSPEPGSSEHNETTLLSAGPTSIEHDGPPSCSSKEGVDDSCHVGEKDEQESQNCSGLSYVWPNVCVYACAPAGSLGDLNGQCHSSNATNFGESLAGLSCIQTSEPNIFDLNQELSVGSSSIPTSPMSHFAINQQTWLVPRTGGW
ncbi:PREDICTED: protein FAR1-RELATED SEQUENCE 5-like isoform X2 [Nelumbo nucifera]|uniref:Protein FAR1-RELATED SEQUENCE 5-like isoform X2 n=1 Tax=Nelumbo nucifera TaxID=4432 RepID=A0A1U8AWA2_NELNU|nr:PREDICTED: protein FAR1-RELATED SEQUENCE 5-like isoform X2 [Nelumbo nucifera]